MGSRRCSVCGVEALWDNQVFLLHPTSRSSLITKYRLDALRKDPKRVSLRPRSYVSTHHHRHSSVRPHHHLSHRTNLRPVLLEPIRAYLTYPIRLHDTSSSSRNFLFRSRLSSISNGPVHCPKRHFNRHGHGSSLSKMDQHSTRVFHTHPYCSCNLPMELCKQRHDLHYRALRMVDLPIWDDWNSNIRLLPRSKAPAA